MGKPTPADIALWRDTLRDGLGPYVERAMAGSAGPNWRAGERSLRQGSLDIQALLGLLARNWGPVFSAQLDRAVRAHAELLRDFRNKDAHQDTLDEEDMVRALESAAILLRAVGGQDAARRLASHREQLLAARYAPKVPAAAGPTGREPEPAVATATTSQEATKPRLPPVQPARTRGGRWRSPPSSAPTISPTRTTWPGSAGWTPRCASAASWTWSGSTPWRAAMGSPSALTG